MIDLFLRCPVTPSSLFYSASLIFLLSTFSRSQSVTISTINYQHLLLPNRSCVVCLGFVYVNPGLYFLSALVNVASPSCVLTASMPRPACLPFLYKVSLCTIAICQNVDHILTLHHWLNHSFNGRWDFTESMDSSVSECWTSNYLS